MKKVYIYKSIFSDDRPNVFDTVTAKCENDAYHRAVETLRGQSHGEYGCDENVSAEIVCFLSSDPETVIEDIQNDLDDDFDYSHTLAAFK